MRSAPELPRQLNLNQKKKKKHTKKGKVEKTLWCYKYEKDKYEKSTITSMTIESKEEEETTKKGKVEKTLWC